MMIFHLMCYFMIYAFLGWCVEVIFQASKKGKVVNRGFLNGPLCPIYGCGVIAILLLMNLIFRGELQEIPAIAVFLIGTVITTLIELIGGFLMDKLFHSRWWDYRNEHFNLNGYICLKFSLIWGLAILMVVRIVHPFIEGIVTAVEQTVIAWVILIVIYLMFIADIIVSSIIVSGLNRKFEHVDDVQKRMRKFSDSLSTSLGEGTLKAGEKAEEGKEKAKSRMDERREKSDDQILYLLHILDEEAADAHIEEEQKEPKKPNRLFGYGRILHAYEDMVRTNYIERKE